MATASKPKMYWDLAPWFHAITHPKIYAGEARWVWRQLLPGRPRVKPTMLELGSGGGNNALHLKKHFVMTLTDLSGPMLAQSRTINPECEHIVGDMRTLRLKRHFDFVFVHDAISYMTTRQDLTRAIKTVFVHCRPGGTALLQPDDVRETFRPSRESGGAVNDGRAARYIELTHAPKSGSAAATVEYALTLTERDGTTQTIVDRHRVGVFSRATWLEILRVQGFRARAITDPWKRVCFIAARDDATRGHRTRSKPARLH